MSNISNCTMHTHQSGYLDSKVKHFISLGMSIIIKCDECIMHHVVALYELGVSREEICECLETAITLQSCPCIKYSQLALDFYDELDSANDEE
nr:carboxymuconolactone decarboxylase family protein [Streptococcus acidominimus]